MYSLEFRGPRRAVGSASDSRARGPGLIPGPAAYFCFSFRWLSVTDESVCTKY